jgi:DNA double-strand break repair helicase HerA and related ATPase
MPSGQQRTPAQVGGKSEVGALLDAFGKSAVRAIGSQVGREVIRGVLGSIFGGTTTRRKR